MFDLNNKKLVESIQIESLLVCNHIIGGELTSKVNYEDCPDILDSSESSASYQSRIGRYSLMSKLTKKLNENTYSGIYNRSGYQISKDDIRDLIIRMDEDPGAADRLRDELTRRAEIKVITPSQAETLMHLEAATLGYSVIPRPILMLWYKWALSRVIITEDYSNISLKSLLDASKARTVESIAGIIRKNDALYTTALELVNDNKTSAATIEILEPVFDMLFTPDTTESSAKPATQSDFLDSVIDRLAEEHQDDDNESEEPDPYAEFTGKSGKRYTEDEIQVFLKKLETTPDKLVWLRKDLATTKFLSDYVVHLHKNLGIPVSRIAKISFISIASAHYKIDQAAGVPTKYYNPKKNSSTYTRKIREKSEEKSDKESVKTPPEVVTSKNSAAESAVNMIFTNVHSKAKQEKPAEQLRISTGGIQFKDCVATTSSGIGLLEFYYHKVISHPNSTPQAKDWARRKLDTVNRMRALLLDLGSN